jgi:hypothetical protein
MNIPGSGPQRLAASLIAAATVLAAGCGVSAAPTGAAAESSGSAASAPAASAPVLATPTQEAATPAGPAECATAGLRVSIGRSGAAAGTTYFSLDFANVSASICFVQGYPGVSLVTARAGSGAQVGAAGRRDPVAPSARIILAPGAAAHSLLGVGTAADYSSATCDPVTAYWLKVFPPDQRAAIYVRFAAATCASTSVTLLSIQRLTAGA